MEYSNLDTKKCEKLFVNLTLTPTAPPCDKELLKLPDYFCPEKDSCTQVPQMVTISFDGAINNNNNLYAEIFIQ